MLLTGDNENAAAHIARTLSIRGVPGGVSAGGQAQLDRPGPAGGRPDLHGGRRHQRRPRPEKGLCGHRHGGVGSDIAVDAADIVLVNDRVEELPHLLALSRRMMTTIRLNLAFSMALNLVAIVLAMTGVLNPVVGALVHNAGSVLVILNSALLLKWRRKS